MIKFSLKRQEQEQAIDDVYSEVSSIIEDFEEFSGKRLNDENVHITSFEIEVEPAASDEKTHEKSNFLYTRSHGLRLPSFGGILGGFHWPFPHDHCTWKWCFDWFVPDPDDPESGYIYEICIEIEYPC